MFELVFYNEKGYIKGYKCKSFYEALMTGLDSGKEDRAHDIEYFQIINMKNGRIINYRKSKDGKWNET
jgi:hypothetical protein